MHRIYSQTYIYIYLRDTYIRHTVYICTRILCTLEHCVEGTVLLVLYVVYCLHCLCDFNSRPRHCLGAYIIIFYRNRTASERRVFLLENCIQSECNIYTCVYFINYYYYLRRSNYRARIILTAHIIFTHARPAVCSYIIIYYRYDQSLRLGKIINFFF